MKKTYGKSLAAALALAAGAAFAEVTGSGTATATINNNTAEISGLGIVKKSDLDAGVSAIIVNQGVLQLSLGDTIGDLTIGANGAVVVKLPDDYSTEGELTLFTADRITFSADGDSLESAIFLTGPVCSYTLSQTEENNKKVVKATLSHFVANTTRKATVFTEGESDSEQWNDQDVTGENTHNNWSDGAPGAKLQVNYDVAFFCQSGRIDYSGGNEWESQNAHVISPGDYVIRGGDTVMRAVGAGKAPVLRMQHIAGTGTLKLEGVGLNPWDNSSMTIDAGVTVTLDELNLETMSGTFQFNGKLNVVKGVAEIPAGVGFGILAVGEHGAIAVDMTGKVTTETSIDEASNRINLFTANTFSTPNGEALTDFIVLTGPVCKYTLHQETANGVTTVYANITDVTKAASTRKATVWKSTEAAWNDTDGNWSDGAPGDGSDDIGIFCADAHLDYHNGQSNWVVTYARMLVRGAEVELNAHSDGSANITFEEIAGTGTVEVLGITLTPVTDSTMTVGQHVTVKTGTGSIGINYPPTVQLGANVTFNGTLVLGENSVLNVTGYESDDLSTSSSINFPSNVRFASGVTGATVTVAGHDDVVVKLTADGEGNVTANVYKITITWTGKANDGKWDTAGNWDLNAVPVDVQTAVFEAQGTKESPSVVKISSSEAWVSNIVFNDGAYVQFESEDQNSQFNINFTDEISGEGTMMLRGVGLKAACEFGGHSDVRVKGLEFETLVLDNNWKSSYLHGPANGEKGGGSTAYKSLRIYSDVTGGGNITSNGDISFYGDNSGYWGRFEYGSLYYHNENWSENYRLAGYLRFCDEKSGFKDAYLCQIGGPFIIALTSGTITFGAVAWQESWGTGIYVPYGTDGLTIEIGNKDYSGSIRNQYQGTGYGVLTMAENATTVDGATYGCSGVTIKKIGKGTLVYGVTKQHTLEVAEGRVEFTGENNNDDDQNVSVTVKEGASIGSSREFSHTDPTWTVGGNVAHPGTFTFVNEASVEKLYVEADDADQTGDSTKRTLTITHNEESKEFTTVVTADPALNTWLNATGGDADTIARERETVLNWPNANGITGIQAYMIGYANCADAVPNMAAPTGSETLTFSFDIGANQSARTVNGLAVNYSLTSSSDPDNWTAAPTAGRTATLEALVKNGPYTKLCAEVVEDTSLDSGE